MGFMHARTLETRWGLGLAFIDLDDETDVEVLRLQLWAPVCNDGSDGKVSLKIGLSPDASDAAHDLMSENNRKALVDMTSERFEAVFASAGIATTLDSLARTEPSL